jgi:hypothetical protein
MNESRQLAPFLSGENVSNGRQRLSVKFDLRTRASIESQTDQIFRRWRD